MSACPGQSSDRGQSPYIFFYFFHLEDNQMAERSVNLTSQFIFNVSSKPNQD